MDIASKPDFSNPFVNMSLLPMLLLSLGQQKHCPDTKNSFKDEYDYVIVGAGSAGSVVAARLSEDPCVSVLLLEAGDKPPILTELPSIPRLFWYTEIDWSYRTTPQKHTGNGLIGRQVIIPSGKCIGGSSVLNDILYSRGNPKNYDDWAAMGAEGWSYADVLPYFTKLEDNRDPEIANSSYHGVCGPQSVHIPRYNPEYRDLIFNAAKRMGYSIVDSTGKTQTGFTAHQGIMRSSQRCSTAKAYLVPAENRKNLDILPNAMVRKVIIGDGEAKGVEFDFQGSTHVVTAKREVILSAGVLHTPKLLMLSGIGPKEELNRFKIPVLADLPVGKNLQDHCGTNVNFLFNLDTPEFLVKLTNPLNIKEYMESRTGPLASSQFIPLLAFLKNGAVNPEIDYPDHVLYFVEISTLLPLLQFNLKPEVYAKVYAPYQNRPMYACLSHILHPKSRGTVTLKSTDPYDPPVIDPNYFAHPDDIRDVVEGLKVCLKIGNSPELKKVGSKIFDTLYPGCEEFAGNDTLYYTCQAKSVVISFTHNVGTAKMGKPDDPTTVVDPKLRVKGIKKLRVIDASVMPTVPSGNTNIPVIMLAEKASDLIKSSNMCEGSSDGSGHENTEHPSSQSKTEDDARQSCTASPWNKELLENKPLGKVL